LENEVGENATRIGPFGELIVDETNIRAQNSDSWLAILGAVWSSELISQLLLHEWLLSSLSWLHIAAAAKVRFPPILQKITNIISIVEGMRLYVTNCFSLIIFPNMFLNCSQIKRTKGK